CFLIPRGRSACAQNLRGIHPQTIQSRRTVARASAFPEAHLKRLTPRSGASRIASARERVEGSARKMARVGSQIAGRTIERLARTLPDARIKADRRLCHSTGRMWSIL